MMESFVDEVKEGLENNQFVLYYQPIIQGWSGSIIGLEALIRWQHPKRGLLLPKDFIPAIEKSKWIYQIGEWVLKEACEQYKIWQIAGFPSFRIAVNISARHFLSKHFVKGVFEMLRNIELEPSCLEIEVTELSLLREIHQASHVLQSLKESGIQIALDDFGTGYNSLSYLKNLSFDRLKIDRSFIQDLPRNKKVKEIVSFMINLAHQLNLEVTAEGVETEDVLCLLNKEGCDCVQGYLISKPLPRKEVEEFLLSHSQLAQMTFF